MSVGPGWNLVGFVNNPSEWCHSTTHLQNTSNIPQNPQKRQKKDKTFTTTFTPHQQPIIYIHNNIHSSSTTNYSHTWNKSLGQNLDETRGAVSLVVDDGSVYLFDRKTDHTHVWGGASGAHWWARQFAATLWHPLSMADVLIQCINNTSTQCIQNTCSCVNFFNYLVSEPDP